MHGKIGMNSRVGQGSTFWFHVEFGKQPDQGEPVTPADLVGLRVLIVDDNATNREIMSHYARAWSMRAKCAASGEEALKAFARTGLWMIPTTSPSSTCRCRRWTA